MNPDSNRFELLCAATDQDEGSDLRRAVTGGPHQPSVGVLNRMVNRQTLLRPNGEPVPEHWVQFQVNECVIIKNYMFKVAYIGETSILFEPVGIPILGEQETVE